MNIGKSITFVFEDQRWLTKVGIGTVVLILAGLLSPILVGILGYFIVAGYGLEVLRNARKGDLFPMPEWRDRWGEWLVLGVKAAVAIFVWSLPAILISLPMAFGFALTDNSNLAVLGALLGTAFACLLFLWVLVVLLATPAIYIRLAETEKLSSAFDFGHILSFTRKHVGQVIVVTLVYVVASFAVSAVGFLAGAILCLVGLFVTLPAAQFITILIQSHLYSQIGLDANSWETSIVPEEYIPEPPAAPSVYETPAEPAAPSVHETPAEPAVKPEENAG